MLKESTWASSVEEYKKASGLGQEHHCNLINLTMKNLVIAFVFAGAVVAVQQHVVRGQPAAFQHVQTGAQGKQARHAHTVGQSRLRTRG